MKTKHTKEPWAYSHIETIYNPGHDIYNPGHDIYEITSDQIVKCVNFDTLFGLVCQF